MTHVSVPRAHDAPAAAQRSRLARAAVAIALLTFVTHLITNIVTPYGVHRDELLYIAMGEHLRLFRMDFPPLIALLANASRIFGDSLVALRLAPALAHAALVLLAAVFVHGLGGRRFASTLAAIAVALSPLFLRAGNLFQPVVFDQLWWTAGYLALVHALAGARSSRAWMPLGVIAGIGLLTKFSIVFFAAGVLVALLLTAARRALLTRGPWLALLIALMLGIPSMAGQIQLGFPVAGQMEDLSASQLARVTPVSFLLEQVLMFGPFILVAVAGVVLLIAQPPHLGWRAAGIASLVSFLTILALRGKSYYVGPVYPLWLAAGAVALERITSAAHARAHVVRALVAAPAIAFQLITLPLGLPLLPPPLMARYANGLGVSQAVTTNRGVMLQLPQDYADMLGWTAMVDSVARVYRSLPPGEQRRTVIIGDNYGRAGAVDLYGPARGLPPAIAPVGSYWYFGPGPLPGDVAIVIGSTREALLEFFRDVELATVVGGDWLVPEEREVGIFIARGPYRSLQEVWPQFEGRN